MGSRVNENSQPPYALSLKGLSKTYHRMGQPLRALSDISFSVEQGDFFGLLGPNGAGKSTLIGVLSSTVRPDQGEIELFGLNWYKQKALAKMTVGIVPQEVTFDPHFTVWETLRLQSGYYGIRDNSEWIEELLDKLDLTDKKNNQVMMLSGGMKRRVLIAQALVHKPPLMILDEPTAGVDINLRHRLWNFMSDLNRQGHTIILTTHYLEEAEALCRNVAMLNEGKLVALDQTQALLAQYSQERIKFYPSSPLPDNFPIKCRAIGNGFLAVNQADPQTLRNLLNELARLQIKPEGLELGKANLEEVFMRITHAHL